MRDVTLGPGLPIDVDRLVSTRLLIQAASGGGKSWCLRRLLEQTHGRVQQLVIDPEGEFATLRERFDYVLAAPHGGDVAADPRTAPMLAERLLELRVSAVLDIYEMKPADRVLFVRRFLEALVNAPKKLWHPALVIVDEAHVFAPEKGDAESAQAVADLMSRGRKRGFAGVLATQRLSSLSKDSAAQCNNVLIGRTTLDTDMKRAAFTLGFTGKTDVHQLRDLDDGEFFVFGPALSRTVVRGRVGPVTTTHPKAGGRQAFTPPPPTATVRAMLAKLADLPAEAQRREKTEADLRAEISTLKRELVAAKKASPAPAMRTVDVPILEPADLARIEQALQQLRRESDRHAKNIERFAELGRPIAHAAETLKASIERARGLGQRTTPGPALRPPVPVPSRPPARAPSNGGGRLGSGEAAVLTAIAQHNDGVTREQVSILTGYKRSTRDAYVQRLGTAGHVELHGDRVLVTPSGVEVLGPDFEPLPTGDALREHWLARLPEGERRCLQVVVEAFPAGAERETISERTGYKRSTRDAYLQRLGTRRLITSGGGGIVQASAELFG